MGLKEQKLQLCDSDDHINDNIYIYMYIYIYLDLPKGAKWLLKGVNSTSLSLSVLLAPRKEGAGIFMFIYFP